MKLYSVRCSSECGTYFMPYLRSITLVASSPASAKKKAKQWMDKEHGGHFVREEQHWIVTELVPDQYGVVDYVSEADY